MSDCSDAMARRWAYLDHEVDGMTCAELEAHLAGCARCQAAFRFDERFKSKIRRCADAGPLSAVQLAAIRERVCAELRQAPPRP